ncbi:MFS transporter [Niabella drilacis]|uniref:Sugar phosphate permease n=1 Tax=Niabella drilacis (strain DSM 25811 / CCM 8410 / CCUG 62505 / LMG 26954 / E90) TaxID=1285928 RepID=A0A1G6S7F1_NIADE|nr:MFS transporter [Niabella drilacis]SDD12611.1 Sugar phosphate permease [Niabella drilacis]
MKEKKYYKWVVVALLWVVALLNYLDRQMLSTMRPSMQIDITELESAATFGHLMAIFLWIYGLMSPVSGLIADRLNRKWLIAGSLFVWSGVTLLMGYATSFNQLYGLRAIMGVSEALYIPAALSLIADYHSSKTRSLAVGIHMIGLYAGQAFGGFGATVAQTYSWQATFHVFGIVGVIYAVVLILFLREHRPEAPAKTAAPSAFKGFRILFANFSFWVLLLYFTVPSIPGWAVKNWLPTLFSDHLGMEMSTAGPIATITIAVASLIGVVTGGLLSDRWVQKSLKGRVYTSAFGVLLTIPALLLLGYGHTLFLLFCGAFCFGFGFGMFDANNMPILCQLVAPRYRATAYGLMNMTSVFFGAWITDLLGRSVDAGHLTRDFTVLAIIVFVAVLLQLVLLNPKTVDYKNEA